MTTSNKRQAAADRRCLIETVRRQSRLLDRRFVTRAAAPELFDLAIAAKYRRGRSILFRGVRFPLKHTWFVCVCDPETGETLVCAGGIL